MRIYFKIFLLMTFSLTAFGTSVRDLPKLQKLLGTKTLSCTPTDYQGEIDPEYKGDDGFFDLSFVGAELKITNNGGSGYGFANGEIKDLIVRDTRIILDVGDDGKETLIFDFDDIGTTSELADNCAESALLMYPNDFAGSARLSCCLK